MERNCDENKNAYKELWSWITLTLFRVSPKLLDLHRITHLERVNGLFQWATSRKSGEMDKNLLLKLRKKHELHWRWRKYITQSKRNGRPSFGKDSFAILIVETERSWRSIRKPYIVGSLFILSELGHFWDRFSCIYFCNYVLGSFWVCLDKLCLLNEKDPGSIICYIYILKIISLFTRDKHRI